MNKTIRAAVFTVALIAISTLSGQTSNARLEGTIQDPSGAVIPGAKATATNTKTGSKNSVTSDAQGHFVITPLTPGIYNLSVEAGGFRRASLNEIELNIGAVSSQLIKLEVGQTSETIEVAASAVAVQTADAVVGRNINLRDIATLPQLNRTPITLALFQPGVQIDIRTGQDASFARINGNRQGSNNSKLDGIDINDSLVPRLGLSLTANNSDSIGEVRMVTSGGKAEYGRNAGGQVEMVTKSGSNSYHGDAHDTLRNTVLNANDFFNNQSGGKVPKFIQNIFGGSFGGKLIKDKTFFFGNYQGRRTAQEVVRNRTIPTASARAGIFKWGTQSFDFAKADPRGLGVDKEVAKIFALYPQPNNFDVGDGLNSAGFRFNNPVVGLEDQFTIKGDHRVSPNHIVFLRWSWQRNSSTDNLNGADASFPGQIQGSQGGRRWGFSTGSDWTINATTANELRVGHQSATTDFLRPARLSGPTYITNLFTDVYQSAFGQGRNSPVNDITDNLTKIWGKHTFKMGASIRSTTQYGYNFAGVYPNVTTGTGNGNAVPSTIGPAVGTAGLTAAQRSVFDSLYNDVLGRMDQVISTFYSDLTTFQPLGSARIRNYKLYESGFFLQDDWRVKRNLTLNIGLRHEYFGLPHETNGLQGATPQASLINGTSALTGITYARTDKFYNKDLNNFAPRFGFAYDPKGDGKTSIRGSWGIFFDRNIGAVINSADGNTPGFSQSVPVFPNQTVGSDRRFAEGVPLPAAPPAPVLTLPNTRSFSIVLFNPDLRTGYVQNFNLNIQREIVKNTILEVGYVGNFGVKLFYNKDYNQPRIYGDFLDSFKQLAAFAGNSANAVPATNTFVRLFGTPQAAVTALGATNLVQGRVGTVAATFDRNSPNFTRYAAAGLSDSYLRLYPQFNQVVVGTNDGRSNYNSLQISIRRNAGALKVSGNYTFAKSIDNISAEGNGFTTPIDTFNLKLNRARSDFDRRHSFNATAVYDIPFGKGKKFGTNMPRVADTIFGGWEIGSLWIVQQGQPFSVSSQRATTAVSGVGNSFAQFTGTDRNIGAVDYRGNGPFFFSQPQVDSFSFPAAGEIGNAGRNVFRNPNFFAFDASLVKKFRITEKHTVSFRAEAYNTLNHTNFGLAVGNLNINTPATFGKFSQTVGTQTSASSARTMQMVLRYEF